MSSVLVTEDVALCYDLHRSVGRRPGSVLRTVGSGWEFVLAARQPAPDLMVLSHWLPDLLGDEVLEQVRRLPGLSAVPVLLLAKGIGPEARARAERLGPVVVFAEDPSLEALTAEIFSQLKIQSRRQRRVAVRLPVELKVRGLTGKGVTRELTSLGASIETELDLFAGERLELSLPGADGGRAVLSTAVVHGAGGHGVPVGLEFVDPTPALQAFLAERLRDSKELASLVGRIERLPALPSVAAKVLEESLKDNADLSAMIALIRPDPALTAHLIKLANAATFQLRSPVTTVERAAVLLGVVAVRNAVLGLVIFRHLSQQAAGRIARSLWQHSLACGLAAELLAPRFEVPREEAFTIGLLHDVGKFVLLAEFHTGDGWRVPVPEGRLSPERERELFGMHHAELGAAILTRWRVPASVHQVVGCHHSDSPDLPPAVRKAVALVRAADALLYSSHLGVPGGTDDGAAVLAAKVRPEELEGLRGQVFTQLAKISAVFGKALEPADLCAEIVERANQRLSTELRASQEQKELLRAAYERSRQQLTSLVQSEKFHALGRIAGGVAHEINNPLSFVNSNLQSLRGYVETLAACARGRPPVDPASLEEVLADLPVLMGEMQQGLGRVRSVVDALRHFVPTGDTTLSLGNVALCATHAAQLASPSRPQGVKLVLGEARVRDTLLDASGLVRAFVEIMLNAFFAMPRGGTLSVDFAEDAQTVAVLFRDTGEGIPEENIKHLFEPFFTTRPVGAGRGLGLSVAYGIVSRLGGQILIRSSPQTGTVVEVRLPLVRV